MTKNQVLMRDVICKYHPEFKKSEDLKEYGMQHSNIFNIERLVEESLAAVGKYEFIDEAGYDFTDYSDSKTTTINASTAQATINNVENKIGALRIVAFNPFKEAADFFFVPFKELNKIRKSGYGNEKYKQRIRFNYSKNFIQDSYGEFDKYRVKSFKALALTLS